jgi:hypothetical protein
MLTIALTAMGAGCGGGVATVAQGGPPSATEAHRPANAVTSAHSHVASPLNNPAQQPDPHAVPCGVPSASHTCVPETTAPSNPNQFRQRNCDTSVVADSATSCAFAENVFYEYYKSSRAAGAGQSLRAHSPDTGHDYSVFCSLRQGLIVCLGEPLATGIYVSFPNAAIASYTATEANAYASSHDLGHPARAQTAPAPSNPPEEGGEGEDEDEVGSYSHEGDEAFCTSHGCIGDFEGESGYVVKCTDGTYSHAGGISGACSSHGGEA